MIPSDKQRNNMARNMRKCCKKATIHDCINGKCKYDKYCKGNVTLQVIHGSIKELSEALKDAGL